MADSPEIRWTVQQRFEFVEWRAYWVGRVNRKDLEDQFGISTPQASLDLRAYQEAAPGNLEYDLTEKAYLATPNFRATFLTPDLAAKRYLLQLHALTTEAIRKEDTWFDKPPPVDVTPTIVRGPEAFELRAVLRAIDMRGMMSINYQSLKRTGMRTICPHTLAHDGYRWHVRALSVEKGEYRDYVIGRILSYSPPTPCNVDHKDDLEWHTYVTLKLCAHPSLDARQKDTIEHDYRFQNGILNITTRAALAFYFIKRHNLDLREGQLSPARAQLYLENYDEIVETISSVKAASKTLIAQKNIAKASNE